MSNKGRVRFLRGTNATIADNTKKNLVLFPGQPFYNLSKNYLTIGDGAKKLNALPLTVRELKGYYGDNSAITNTTANEYSISGNSTDGLYVKAPDKINFKIGTSNKLTINSNESKVLNTFITATGDLKIIESKKDSGYYGDYGHTKISADTSNYLELKTDNLDIQHNNFNIKDSSGNLLFNFGNTNNTYSTKATAFTDISINGRLTVTDNVIVKNGKSLTVENGDITASNGSFTWLNATDIANVSNISAVAADLDTIEMNGNITFTDPLSNSVQRGIYGSAGKSDGWRIVGGSTADNASYLEIATTDDGEPIYVRQYLNQGGADSFTGTPRTLTLLDASGNTYFPGEVHCTKIYID